MAESPVCKQDDSVERLAKALSHPVRLQILMFLAERAEASPNEMCQDFGEKLGTVSYHARALVQHRLLELVKTKPRRGALEHYYRLLPLDGFLSVEWRQILGDLRGRVAGVAVNQLVTAFTPGMTQDNFVSRWLPLYVDERGAKAIARAIQRAEEQILRASDESRSRLDGSVSGISIRVALSYFETGGPARDQAGG